MTAVSTFPRRAPRWRVVRTLVAREYASKRTYRLAFILDLLFGIANLFVYYFISRTLGAGDNADLGDAPTYFAFALVGIAITNVIGAASTGLAYRIREEQFTGTLEALLIQPVKRTVSSATPARSAAKAVRRARIGVGGMTKNATAGNMSTTPMPVPKLVAAISSNANQPTRLRQLAAPVCSTVVSSYNRQSSAVPTMT